MMEFIIRLRDYDIGIGLQRKYLYYYTAVRILTESCGTLWLKNKYLYYFYPLYRRRPFLEPISYNIQLFYFNFVVVVVVVAVTGLSGGMSHWRRRRRQRRLQNEIVSNKICFQFIHISHVCVFVYNARLQYFRSS